MTLRTAMMARIVRRGVVRRSAAAALGIATVLGAAGCGGPVNRAITGNVTLDGKPLDEAVIIFIPLAIQAGKTGAAIKAGRYEVPRDVGLIPGRYRVEIADDPPIDRPHHPAKGSQPPARRPFPVVYGSVASPLLLEMTADADTNFDFALTSQASRTP